MVRGHIRDLLNQLWTVEARWDQLGLQLDLPIATLDVITRDHPTTRERFTKMLEEWVKGRATKRILINALRSEAIRENLVADNVEKWPVPSIPLQGELCLQLLTKTLSGKGSKTWGLMFCPPL